MYNIHISYFFRIFNFFNTFFKKECFDIHSKTIRNLSSLQLNKFLHNNGKALSRVIISDYQCLNNM